LEQKFLGVVFRWFLQFNLSRSQNMDDYRHSRLQQLERLRVELAAASRLLDELERRDQAPDQKTIESISGPEIYPTEGETRFAACVSHGLAKLGAR
jgi:hypothetical protein